MTNVVSDLCVHLLNYHCTYNLIAYIIIIYFVAGRSSGWWQQYPVDIINRTLEYAHKYNTKYISSCRNGVFIGGVINLLYDLILSVTLHFCNESALLMAMYVSR